MADHLTKFLVRNKGDLPQYYVEDSHPAIIDKATFDKVQDKLAENAERFAGKSSKNKYVFTGKITCKKCGKNYTRKVNHGRIYWACNTYLRFGKSACSTGQIPEKILIEKVNEALGLETFSEEIFHQKIQKILILDRFKLGFVFDDGTKVYSDWQHKSRSESWDEDAKERARVLELKKRRESSLGNI